MNDREQLLYMQARLSRIASEKWRKPLAYVIEVFSQYKVLEYIEDCFELFHVQGDEANFDDIACYLRRKGAHLC